MPVQQTPGNPQGGNGPAALSRLLADDPVEAAAAWQALGLLEAGPTAEAAAAWLMAPAPPSAPGMVDRIMAHLPEGGPLAAGRQPELGPLASARAVAGGPSWASGDARPKWRLRLVGLLRPRPLLMAGGLACLALALGLSIAAGGDGGLSAASFSPGTHPGLPPAAFPLILGLVLLVLAARRR